MESDHCHGKHPPALAPPRRESKHAAGASFSASLLDAIYHSLDEGKADVVDTKCRSEEKATAPLQFWWAKEPAAKTKQKAGADRRRRETAVARPRHSGYASSTTSSSDSSSSSYSLYSSASTTDTESTHRRRHSPPPPRQPEEDAADSAAEDAAPPNNKAKKKGRPCFPGARLRPRGAAPSSPGPLPPSPATFACVLKALFTSARSPRRPKTPTAVPPPQTLPESPKPSCTSAASTAKAAELRSVRFCPDPETTSVVRRRVEELVRSLGEVEEDEEGSDSSSDLFELESLRGADGDELPVYGTTSLVANRAIAHGATC